MYVSPAGSDGNSGCSRDKPKASIGSAIGIVKTLGLREHEIHVCRGVFHESLVLDHPVSIRGGYECALWTRTATYGFGGFLPNGRASGFDRANETRLEGVDGATATLTIGGASIDRKVAVEGMNIVGMIGSDQGVAVRIKDGAQPTLTNNDLIGALGASTVPANYFASLAIMVITGAPSIIKNRIRGGSGTGSVHGSGGVWLANATSATLLQENEIGAGQGIGSLTSVLGIVTTGTTDLEAPISNNRIFWSGKGAPYTGIGIGLSQQGRVDVKDNFLVGGAQECLGSATCTSIGILSEALNSVITNNRIHAGVAGQPAQPMTTRAIQVTNAGEASVVGNLLYTVGGTQRFGIWTEFGQTVNILGNTIFTGGGTDLNGHVLVRGTASVTLENNLMLTVPQGRAVAIRSSSCLGGTTNLVVANNAFVGADVLSDVSNTSPPVPPNPPDCSKETSEANLDNAAAKLNTLFGAQVRNNVQLYPTCDASSGCRVEPSCATGSGCAGAVIDGWDAATMGGSQLFATGWKLAPTALCVIAKGGLSLPAINDAKTDHFGTVRTELWSIGAHESDAPCVQ